MKKLLLALLCLPLSLSAQKLYFTGGYVMDRPTLRDGTKENGLVSNVNGSTYINKIGQNGFYAGAGLFLKAKKTSTFGFRAEAAYEHFNQTMERTVTTQETAFTPQQTFASDITSTNSYLRLTPTISYCQLKRSGRSYQADLGLSQLIHLSGWKDNSSFTAVHVSAGIGYKGVLLKAGGEIGLVNTLAGEGRGYTAFSKRFFAGLVVYPSLFRKPKLVTDPQVIPTVE
jgi:hypothetical protein